MARSKTSSAWLNEHVHDFWVNQAQKDGYRARSAYKLLEINEKDRLIQPGMRVVDLGAAPGSWSQIASQLVGSHGQVIALDILPMDPLPHVDFIQGDFREDAVLAELVARLGGHQIDLVISDIAPNMSGNRSTDQARSHYLVELALMFAQDHLRPGGSFLVKVFQGSEFNAFLSEMRDTFSEVLSRKPKASRDRSSEIYLLGRGRR